MTDAPHVLAVVPARSGSKGVPRKNLGIIAGKPLLYWVLQMLSSCTEVDEVLVSTDCEEIAGLARSLGVGVVIRPVELALDCVTLDPVVHHAVEHLERMGQTFDIVLTVQPTSPLLRASTVAEVVQRLSIGDVDTVLTAIDASHLEWDVSGEVPVPNYAQRLNRQELPRKLRETGGILGTRREFVSAGGRIGPRTALVELDSLEGLDIDTTEDWLCADAALTRKRIAFITIGNRASGLGHCTRVQQLAECLLGHPFRIFCHEDEDMALTLFRSHHLSVEAVAYGGMAEAVAAFNPDVVVHDELDTDPEAIVAEKSAGRRVVCIEDRGAGPEHAHAVINALYPAEKSDHKRGHWYGPDVYCLREQFRRTPQRDRRGGVQRVLVTFGGTDPAGLTLKTMDALRGHCSVPITVVIGAGYGTPNKLKGVLGEMQAEGMEVELLRDVPLMSEVMLSADIAISSAGRTMYELASLHVPTLVMAQNAIELRHTFASIENGFLFLGLGDDVAISELRAAFRSMIEGSFLRESLRQRMETHDFSLGRDRVIRLILGERIPATHLS